MRTTWFRTTVLAVAARLSPSGVTEITTSPGTGGEGSPFRGCRRSGRRRRCPDWGGGEGDRSRKAVNPLKKVEKQPLKKVVKHRQKKVERPQPKKVERPQPKRAERPQPKKAAKQPKEGGRNTTEK